MRTIGYETLFSSHKPATKAPYAVTLTGTALSMTVGYRPGITWNHLEVIAKQ
jgi:hypothetical protein